MARPLGLSEQRAELRELLVGDSERGPRAALLALDEAGFAEDIEV